MLSIFAAAKSIVFKTIGRIGNERLRRALEGLSPTHRLASVWEIDRTAGLEEIWLRSVPALEKQLARLNAQVDANADAAERLQLLVEDHQFMRVYRNYVFECQREAMDDRREMLACAANGSVSIDLSLAEIARTERVLRELDPEAVALLAVLAADEDGYAWEDAEDENPHFEVLVTSGCVHVGWEQSGFHRIEELGSGRRPFPASSETKIPRLLQDPRITTLGRHVLLVLQDYLTTMAKVSDDG